MARCEDFLSTEAQKAYMAGIIDGEGCIYVNRRKPTGRRVTPGYGVKVCVSITSRSIVDWFEAHAGLTSTFFVKSKRNENRQAKFSCTWNNSNAERLLKAIRPYMIIKAEQADLAIPLLIHLRTSKVRGGLGKVVSEDEIAYRESIKAKIAFLNRRGYRDE